MGGGRAPAGDGDDLTFEDFVTATAGRLLRTAYFLVYDRYLAEDLVQATYEKVARRWRRVARTAQPEAYARKVLVNLAIDDRRRRARHHDLPVGSLTEMDQIAARHQVTVHGPSEGLDDLLAALPVKQRAVVVLRYWCDLSEHEIAETLGISRGTVKSHAARALSALRGRLAPTASDSEGTGEER